MLRLSTETQGSMLPVFKASIEVRTNDSELHRMRIKANYVDLCLMKTSPYWIRRFITYKSSQWIRDRFSKMETIGIDYIFLNATDGLLADLDRGLKKTSAYLTWREFASNDAGSVRIDGLYLYQIAQTMFDDLSCNRDIKLLAGQETIDTIVAANRIAYPELTTWRIKLADDNDAVLPLQRYYKRQYEGIDY